MRAAPPPPTAAEIFDFVMRHCPRWRPAPAMAWVSWMRRAYCSQVHHIQDADGRILSLAMGRPVNNVLDACADYYHLDPPGDILFIDLLVSAGPRHTAALWRRMLDAHGWRDWVAFERRGRLRMHSFKRFEHLLLRGHHGES